MSLSYNTSIRSTHFSLPSYTAAARLPQPPTYEQLLESLPAPERAFIADQAHILNNIRNPSNDQKPTAINSDPDIERLQALLDPTHHNTQPIIPARQSNSAAACSIILSILLLCAFPILSSFLEAFADQLSGSSSTECLGRHRPTAKAASIYLGAALVWLSAWVLVRVWRCRICIRNGRVGYKWSVFWSLSWGLGFCILVGVVWARKMCV